MDFQSRNIIWLVFFRDCLGLVKAQGRICAQGAGSLAWSDRRLLPPLGWSGGSADREETLASDYSLRVACQPIYIQVAVAVNRP